MQSRDQSTHINRSGFTLAELLIALAILGVIASFTIPKLLDVSVTGKSNSICKETAAMVAGAYQTYKSVTPPKSTTSIGDLTPYMNYVKTDTTSFLDSGLNGVPGAIDCSQGYINCLRLHNGALMAYRNDASFGGTNNTNVLFFLVDPNGVYDNPSATGNSLPGQSVQFFLYYTGSIRDYKNADNNIADSLFTYGPTVHQVTWFSWN